MYQGVISVSVRVIFSYIYHVIILMTINMGINKDKLFIREHVCKTDPTTRYLRTSINMFIYFFDKTLKKNTTTNIHPLLNFV